MSQLLKEMFRRLADKSGYGSPRSRSRPRPDNKNNGSPNASPVLDLSHRGRRSRSGSLRRRLREEQSGASAPESRPVSPVPSKLRELVYPPEPKRVSTSPGIFGRRDAPLQAPEHLHDGTNDIDFYPRRKGILFNADVHRIWAGVFCIIILSLVAAYTIAHITLTKHQQEVVTSQIAHDLLSSGQEDTKNEVALGYQSLLSELILRRHMESEPEIGFDFSLSTLGAKVLTTRNTKSMPHYDATFLGFAVWSGITEDPHVDAPLQPILMPGRCWRFVGFPGTLVIQLAESISVTSFALAHVMGATVPKHRLTSAPFEFEVWGLDEVNDQNSHLFGNYTMQLNGVSNQDFEVQFPLARTVPNVELRVLSNHGSAEYTCVYRFKVFGTPQDFE